MATVLRKLHSEMFVLNLRQPLRAVPELPGYALGSPDDGTLEVEVTKEQNLNDLFARCPAQGIEVVSMRNKANRLEELFMRLVEGRDAGTGAARARRSAHEHVVHAAAWRRPRPAAAHRWVGLRTIVIREFSRIVRIWGQTIVPPAITATLYFIIFGSLIGRRIGDMGGFTLHAVHRARADHDVRDHQQLRQRGVVVLRREVRPPHRGAAGGAAAELADRARLHRRAACCAACWWARRHGGRAVLHAPARRALADRVAAVLLTALVFSLAASSTPSSRRTSTRSPSSRRSS